MIIALGPLTNVALAIQNEPDIMKQVKEIFVMGGAVEVGGNVTPYAEFNIYDDPRAANVVFDSGIPITLVGLDVCERVAFGPVRLRLESGNFHGRAAGGADHGRLVRNPSRV